MTLGGLKFLAEYWPEIIVPVHLGLSMELQHGSRFPQRQRRREQAAVPVEATVVSLMLEMMLLLSP